jgi:hypothetical protein
MNAQDFNPPSSPLTGAQPAEKSYSPFWALLVVSLTLICIQVTYLSDDSKQKAQIQNIQNQLNAPTVNGPMTQARAIGNTTEAIGYELLALSVDSAEASNIVAEFSIKLNAPLQPAK